VTNMHQQNQQVEGIWKKARQSHPHEPAASPVLSKLHWGAAGYHYDWTARKYYPQDYSPVPQRLAALGQQCAEACGETLEAEAVIVNFYKKSSTMGGHQDDVEDTMAHPVVSLSLGSDCVFLKGTCTKEDAPLEVLLRSGDLAVLCGNSRLSYHGVAKVLPRAFAISDQEMEALVAKKMKEEHGKEGNHTADEWWDELRAVKRYLETHRININIRQVYERPGDPAAEAEHEAVVSLPAETNTEGGEEAHVSKRQKVCAK
jgi:alkylated DNA repair protein alkB homolog 1